MKLFGRRCYLVYEIEAHPVRIVQFIPLIAITASQVAQLGQLYYPIGHRGLTYADVKFFDEKLPAKSAACIGISQIFLCPAPLRNVNCNALGIVSRFNL